LIIAVLVLVVIIVAVGLAGTIWFVSYGRRLTQGKETTTEERLPFRWSYIIAPLVIFLLSIILSAYFYHLLPGEVAVHFELDGTPDSWLEREMTMVWALVPQLLLTLLAGGVAWGITKLIILLGRSGSIGIRPARMASFMGNFVALPQLIVLFAMLDIFVYNAYQTHIMPTWIFLLALLGLATIVLGIFMVFIFLRARRLAS